jgi:hypothetical protein
MVFLAFPSRIKFSFREYFLYSTGTQNHKYSFIASDSSMIALSLRLRERYGIYTSEPDPVCPSARF